VADYERIDAQARGGQGGNSRGGTDTSTFQTRALDFRVDAVGSRDCAIATRCAQSLRGRNSPRNGWRLKYRRIRSGCNYGGRLTVVFVAARSRTHLRTSISCPGDCALSHDLIVIGADSAHDGSSRVRDPRAIAWL